jgi:hypothetical protein
MHALASTLKLQKPAPLAAHVTYHWAMSVKLCNTYLLLLTQLPQECHSVPLGVLQKVHTAQGTAPAGPAVPRHAFQEANWQGGPADPAWSQAAYSCLRQAAALLPTAVILQHHRHHSGSIAESLEAGRQKRITFSTDLPAVLAGLPASTHRTSVEASAFLPQR